MRLILRHECVEVHQAHDDENVCNVAPCGETEIGIDKGYSEAFIDSDGEVYGEGLGNLLSDESDFLKIKYQRRNKLKAIAEAKPDFCSSMLLSALSAATKSEPESGAANAVLLISAT